MTYTTILCLYYMVRKYLSDKEEKDYLRRENEELKRQLAVISQTSLDDLSAREKKVLKFVKDHPGTSKEKVIQQLTREGAGSRMTIIRALDNVEAYGLISVRKEKQNSQTYKLYINQDNTFLTVYNDLNIFGNIFSNIIEKITEKGLHKSDWLERNSLLYHLVLLCHHVLGVYLIYFMLKWQKEILDKEVLNKLYSIVVYRIIEIQSKLSETFKTSGRVPDFSRASVGEVFSPILQSSIHHMFLLDPERIIEILEDYKKYDLHEEIMPLIDKTWKIGFPLYPFKELNLNVLSKDLDKFQNFRLAIAHASAKKNLKVSHQMWKILNHNPPEFK
jgi:Fe2+ or Zn2+ uptake regulation protein